MARRSFGYIRTRKRNDGSNSYQAGYVHPATGKRVTKTFRAKAAAAAWLKQTEREILTGTLDAAQPETSPAVPTVKEYCNAYLSRLEARNVSPNTMRSYLSTIRVHILPTLGGYRLDQLTREVLANWYAGFDPAKPGARRNAYRTLSAVLNAAVEDELIGACPLKIKGALAKPRVRNEARERVASVEQVEQIAALMPPDMGVVVFLAAWAGLRYSEIAALRRKHIDLAQGVIRVRAAVKRAPNGGLVEGPPKSAMGVRDVPIAPMLREALGVHLSEHVKDGPDALIVHSPATPVRFLSNESLHTRYDKAVKAVGLAGFGFHQLRATCATWLMRSGATPAEIQAILGHSDWATSQLYQRAPRERLQQVMAELGD